MRDFNYRSILSNRATITISQTVYDRRALDNTSDLPLINSLNHLTFLTSSSSKVRETMSEDGALERLVSILHECYIKLHEMSLIYPKTPQGSVDAVERERKMAMLAWKWTLTYQCLVLTGTRGTQDIRKRVVQSGVLPVIATVLDNYMIFHKNFDFLRDKKIDFTFKEILNNPLLQLKDEEIAKLSNRVPVTDPYFAEYNLMEEFKILLGNDISNLSNDHDYISGKHCEPLLTQISTDFESLWGMHLKNNMDLKPCSNILISIPRDFFLGKIIPKLDDITWSVQLLAFLTKNTSTKQFLETVSLVDSISLRPILENSMQRMAHSRGNPLDLALLMISETSNQNMTSFSHTNLNVNQKKNITNPLLLEIQGICKDNCYQQDQDNDIKKDYILHIKTPINTQKLDRLKKEQELRENFKRNWDYSTVSKVLDDETWNHILKIKTLNLFALVERYTIKSENDSNITYWSSVVMRNSCRKHESTGVRQCANFECGKWEEYPKQFPKCRRCKRTKYCSRECQLKSWEYHRHWCHEVNPSSTGLSFNGNTDTYTPSDTTTSEDPAATGATTGTTAGTSNVDQSILSTARNEIVGPQGIVHTNRDLERLNE